MIADQIRALIDFCSPTCQVRTRFLTAWRANGIDSAYGDWKRRDDLINPDLIPQIELLIEKWKQSN